MTEPAILKLLDTNYYDILALVETHTPTISRALYEGACRNRYIKLELPARHFANAGRFVGGTVVFIKANM